MNLSIKLNKEIPFNTELPEFVFPDYEILNIDNIHSCLYQDKSTPLISIGVVFPFGTINDHIDGIGSFSSSVLLKGTKSKSPYELFKEIEILGAKISTQINSDFFTVSLTCLAKNFLKCSEILLDILVNPAFLPTEIELQKKKSIANIKLDFSNPAILANIAFNSIMFYGHPYSKYSNGKADIIEQFSQKDCLSWYENNLLKYRPFIVIVGNFNHRKTIDFIQKFASNFGSGSNSKYEQFKIRKHNYKLAYIEYKEAFQSSIRLGTYTIDKLHPDYPKLSLLNTIFGGYFLSRLNKRLREELGLTYGIDSQIVSNKYSSHLVIRTEINSDSTRFATDNIFNVIDKLQKEEIDDNEFLTAKQHIFGSFFRSIETPQQIGNIIKWISAYHLPKDYYTDFFQKLKKLTPADLIVQQQSTFSSDKFLISLACKVGLINHQFQDFNVVKCNEYGEFLEN